MPPREQLAVRAKIGDCSRLNQDTRRPLEKFPKAAVTFTFHRDSHRQERVLPDKAPAPGLDSVEPLDPSDERELCRPVKPKRQSIGTKPTSSPGFSPGRKSYFT